MVCQDTALAGLDALWQVVLDARDEYVANAAITLLVDLHVKLAVTVDRKAAWAAFVGHCMDRLALLQRTVAARHAALGTPGENDAVAADDAAVAVAAADVQRLARTIRVLLTFLTEVEKPDKPPAFSGTAHNTATACHVYVWDNLERKGVRPPAVVIDTPPGTLVGDVRRSVATQINHAVDCVRLETFSGTKLASISWDERPISAVYFGRSLNCFKLERPAPDTEGAKGGVVGSGATATGDDAVDDETDENDRRHARELLSTTDAYVRRRGQRLHARLAAPLSHVLWTVCLVCLCACVPVCLCVCVCVAPGTSTCWCSCWRWRMHVLSTTRGRCCRCCPPTRTSKPASARWAAHCQKQH